MKTLRPIYIRTALTTAAIFVFAAGLIAGYSAGLRTTTPPPTPIPQQDMPYAPLAELFFTRGIEPLGQAQDMSGKPTSRTNWDLAISTMRQYPLQQQTVNPNCVFTENDRMMASYPGSLSLFKLKPERNITLAESVYVFNVRAGSELPPRAMLEQVVEKCAARAF